MKGRSEVLFQLLSLCLFDGTEKHNMNRSLGLNPEFSDYEAGTTRLYVVSAAPSHNLAL